MLDPKKRVTIGMVFPIEDLQLSPVQLANLDEEDLPRLSELVFSILVGDVDDLHATVRTAVQTLLDEKHEIRKR